MRSSLIDKILRETPLETRVQITIESYFICEYGGSLLVPLDDEGNDLIEVVEANKKCLEKAEPLIKFILDDIKQWKEENNKYENI